jgi:hypothetical protein
VISGCTFGGDLIINKNRAEAAAAVSHRSPTQRIEQWAQIGRVLEPALSCQAETAIKPVGQPELDALLDEIGSSEAIARTKGQNACEATRAIAEIRDELIQRKTGFITETVSSDPVGEKVTALARAAEIGFDVTLIYIGLASSKLSHDRGRARLPRVLLYDNSSFASPHRFLAEFRVRECVRKGDGVVPKWAAGFVD